MNREVNLSKRVQTSKGLRYCPVVTSKNGRIKPDVVLIDGKEERHTEGAYYLSWYRGRKLIRLSVGKDAADASARRLRKEAELNANNNGEVSVLEVSNNGQNGHRSVALAVTGFLDETKLTKKPKTYAAYSTALKYFQESCPKLYLEDIERRDLLKFSAFLRDVKQQSPRSVYNKFENIMTFLKAQGVRGLVGKNDWPRFVEEEPEVYERGELEKLFAVCDEEERLWYEFFLMTGMREKEVMHCSWADVNLTRSTVTVRYQPEYGFSPKLNFLDDLKDVVERANLDKENFWLHKFRPTFATWHLWNSVDLRTVQMWLGHSDMESTMRYLKPSRSQAVRDRVDSTFGGEQ